MADPAALEAALVTIEEAILEGAIRMVETPPDAVVVITLPRGVKRPPGMKVRRSRRLEHVFNRTVLLAEHGYRVEVMQGRESEEACPGDP